MKASIKDKLTSALLTIAIIVFTITFSIGLPIYVRPFYYAHIKALNLEENTGLTEEVIREAYDEVLDYLTLWGGEFSSGELGFSEEGASHFADCKRLFNLNLWGFLLSGALIVVVSLLRRRKKVSAAPACGLGACFWSGVSTLSLFGIIAAVVCADFDTAFYVFHAIFFPGKDNWLFDPDVDEIINVMPQEFFMNCAILIVSSIVLISILLIVAGVMLKRKRKK